MKLPDAITLVTPKPTRLPTKLAARIDAFYDLREERLAYGRKIEEAKKVLSHLKEREDEIARGLAAELRKLGGGSKLSGQVATFSPGTTPIFIVEDWPAFHAYIQQTGEFELLEARASRGALKERAEDGGKLPPGVKQDSIFSYSLTKLGAKK